MLFKNQAKIAEAAMRLVYQGTPEQIDAFEDREGCSLSTTVDALWAAAEEQGDPAMAKRLEAAYDRLTGRDTP